MRLDSRALAGPNCLSQNNFTMRLCLASLHPVPNEEHDNDLSSMRLLVVTPSSAVEAELAAMKLTRNCQNMSMHMCKAPLPPDGVPPLPQEHVTE